MEEKSRAPASGAVPVTPPAAAVRRVYMVDSKDRILLLLALCLGILCADVLFCGVLGLGVTLAVAAWYAILLWYGGAAPLCRRENRLLLGAVGLLALTFALYANPWFRGWNFCALLLLAALHAAAWTGVCKQPWSTPHMLWERLLLFLQGCFETLGAPLQTLCSIKGMSRRKTPYILMGLFLCIPLLMIVFPLLASADALFQQMTGQAMQWLYLHLSGWAVRLVIGAILTPFLFALLYFLRRPKALKEEKAGSLPEVEAAAPITVLMVMDILYAFFLAVQFTALFGGEDYLSRAGISYAEYARSGFFQLVFVAAVNLTLVLLCLQLCKKSGRGFRAVQILTTILVAVSFLLLFSAAGRMTLYVNVYGLSFKRALTYWGMALLALFLAAALWKIWRPEFRFFRVLFAASLAGWLVLNYANVDALVVRYNIGREMEPAVILSASSRQLGALPALEGLSRQNPDDLMLADAVEQLRQKAAWEASRWETWSVTAQRGR